MIPHGFVLEMKSPAGLELPDSGRENKYNVKIKIISKSSADPDLKK